MKYAAVLFDFDYTLADSSRGIVTCFSNVLNNNNFSGFTEETIKRTIGKTLQESFSILTGVTDGERLEALRIEYGRQADVHMTVNTFLFPEVERVLTELKNQGVMIGIISTKYRFRIMEFLDKYFPAGFFDIVIGGEDITYHKPHPEGLLKAMEMLEVTTENTLYVGDSLVDAETAYRAGVDFIGVTSGMTMAAEFDAFPYVRVIRDMGELLE